MDNFEPANEDRKFLPFQEGTLLLVKKLFYLDANDVEVRII